MTGDAAPTIGLGTRERIIAAAAAQTTAHGWASVTMGGLAKAAGVSRQTVYNEIGGKSDLAQALVFAELARFLTEVEEAFDAHPDDLVAAVRAAAYGVLELAARNELLRSVVSATHGADTELLPLLTTNAESLLGMAKAAVASRIEPYGIPFADYQQAAGIDVIVRVVLSHVMQPSGTPAETADNIAWIASQVLRA
ncbi:TetR/AcrR family transcriptional regulator [Luteipulveratus halotolerans]|nr:TetR family transcriptional regulator [Luteipulveratus halotolerans]